MITAGATTVKIAALEVVLPHNVLAITRNCWPFMAVVVAAIV